MQRKNILKNFIFVYDDKIVLNKQKWEYIFFSLRKFIKKFRVKIIFNGKKFNIFFFKILKIRNIGVFFQFEKIFTKSYIVNNVFIDEKFKVF